MICSGYKKHTPDNDKRAHFCCRFPVIYDKSDCHEFFWTGGACVPIFAISCYFGILFLTVMIFWLQKPIFCEYQKTKKPTPAINWYTGIGQFLFTMLALPNPTGAHGGHPKMTPTVRIIGIAYCEYLTASEHYCYFIFAKLEAGKSAFYASSNIPSSFCIFVCLQGIMVKFKTHS